jgi:hypothetical protein
MRGPPSGFLRASGGMRPAAPLRHHFSEALSRSTSRPGIFERWRLRFGRVDQQARSGDLNEDPDDRQVRRQRPRQSATEARSRSFRDCRLETVNCASVSKPTVAVQGCIGSGIG